MGELATIFLAAHPAGGEVDPGALEELLAALAADARGHWPGVELDDEAFVAHLAARAPRDAADLSAALRALATRDLWLACACARDAPGAVAAFDRHFLSRLPLFLAGLRLDRASLDDARQLVSQRLLLPRPDGPSRIAEYSGRGSLEGWLRIAAIRTVLNERERERAHARLDESAVGRRLLPAADAELELIRARHREDLLWAFRAALDELAPRERTLLGLHFLEGVPTQELGPMYGVHRTTVGRWIEGAQRSLLEGTRRKLEERLRLSDSECDSLIALLRSQLDVTLRTILER